MQHDAARLKGTSFEEMPVDQPMRPAARREIARNPSTDQKRQRRQQMRKSANPAANGWQPGHVSCGSCGYKGHPVLGDTGRACAHCNSYSVSNTPRPGGAASPSPAYPDNSRHLDQSDYVKRAARSFDQCGYCGTENAAVKDGLCPQHEHLRDEYREDDDRWQSQDDHHYQASQAPTVPDYLTDDDMKTLHSKAGCPGCGGRLEVAEHHDGTATNQCVSAYCGQQFTSSKEHKHDGDCPKCGSETYTWQGDVAVCSKCGHKSGKEWTKGAAKQATVLDTRAEMLNPGDQIRTPQGQTQKVNRVRPHETSAKHVYVDTDGGTALVERGASFQVSPRNSQQQSMPGYGTPGGNSNRLPFDPQASGDNSAPTTKCPNCSGPGTLARQGDHYSCSRCGYREKFGGAGGHAFSDNPSVVKTFSTINSTTHSAVARRAMALLNQSEETP